MKIGIYTQPLRYNYGGLLQAWALQTVLRRMGHDVVTFDPCPYRRLSWKRKPIVYTKRIIKKLFRHSVVIKEEEKFNKEHDIKIQNLKPFIDANILRLEFCDVRDIKVQNFDVLIVGSDQVWRPKYNRTYGRTIENAFFDFVGQWDGMRIAYAASFGTDEWEFTDGQTKCCGNLAKRFSAISVREQSGIALCEKYFGVSAKQVLDPTMLLDKCDYEEIINARNTSSPSGNLLCYILDETDFSDKLIKKISAEKGLISFRANSKVTNVRANIEEKIQPPVEQWLRNFKEAEFIITDSFHACVFSIIFGKPFVVIGNEKRGISRYDSLFSMLSMKNHLIRSIDEFASTCSYSIDKETYQRINNLKEYSLKYLMSSLNANNCLQ